MKMWCVASDAFRRFHSTATAQLFNICVFLLICAWCLNNQSHVGILCIVTKKNNLIVLQSVGERSLFALSCRATFPVSGPPGEEKYPRCRLRFSLGWGFRAPQHPIIQIDIGQAALIRTRACVLCVTLRTNPKQYIHARYAGYASECRRGLHHVLCSYVFNLYARIQTDICCDFSITNAPRAALSMIPQMCAYKWRAGDQKNTDRLSQSDC